MPTKTFAPLLGKRIRVTRLDNCGLYLPAATEDAFIATEGFMSVSMSAEVDTGTELLSRRADNSLCINEKLSDSFKRLNLTINFCDVNPSLLAMVSNAEPYLDYAGDVAGYTLPEGKINKRFAFEMWTGLAGVACGDGEEASGYMLLPHVNAGITGNIEMNGDSTVTFSMTGAYTRGDNGWGVGPYDVMIDSTTADTPAPLPTPLDPFDHFLLVDTRLAPPPSADDPQPMPAVG